MSTKITPKVKNKVWQDYTKNPSSKTELKQMFLGMNPTNAYKKISSKLKKKLDQVKVSSSPIRKTLRPKKTINSSFKSPSRKHEKSIRTFSPKRIKSPKRKTSPSRKSNKDKLSSVRLIKS